MKNYTQKNAKLRIFRMIESLLGLLLFRGSIIQKLVELKKDLEVLKENNREFHEALKDKRENSNFTSRLIIIIIGVGIDVLLSYQAMVILCFEYNWPTLLKYLIPIVLVVVEIGVSYFQFIRQRIGERASWLIRNLQYFVLLILLALSVLAVQYSAQMYNPAIDTISFISYFSMVIIFQAILFISSLMLHLWMIRNSEQIMDAIAFFLYQYAHKKITGKIETLELKDTKKYNPMFTQDAQHLVQSVEDFNFEYPNSGINFKQSIPTDLINAINTVMGKIVFTVTNESNDESNKVA
jgi:hypothetical protein